MNRYPHLLVGFAFAATLAACFSDDNSTTSGNAGAGGSSVEGGTGVGGAVVGAGGVDAGRTLGVGGSVVGAGGVDASMGTGGATGTGGGVPTTDAGVPQGDAAEAGVSGPAEFVTSGPNDYWHVQAAVQPAVGAAELIIDPSKTFQKLTGFGGTFNEQGWDALSVLSADDVAKAMKLLFDSKDGANFVYGRLPMGASDYAMSWYTLDDLDPDAGVTQDLNMEHFSIERDRKMLIPYIKAALQVNPNIQLWASPWMVPHWMTAVPDGGWMGSMIDSPEILGAHALYMARFVEEYAKEGLNLVAIHPQNEPGYAMVKWTQAEFIDFIKTYLGPTFKSRGITAQIFCGTMSKDPDDTNIAKALAKDPEAMKYTTGFGVQWNLQAAVAELSQSGPVWMTEHKCGNYNFTTPYWDQSRYDKDKAQNDHLYGEESWQLIRDWIVSGVTQYSAWNMVLDTIGMSLGRWPQNALLTVDRDAKTLNITPAYYAFRHYSRYVQPNSTRIKIDGSKDAMAFLNPDGSIVAEVYNSGEAAKATSVGVGTSTYSISVPSHGWATVVIPK